MGILFSMLIGGLIGYLIGSIIDEFVIKERLQDDGAFYGTITKIQPRTITIKEIDDDGDFKQNVKLESDKGISDSLYKGQKIFA